MLPNAFIPYTPFIKSFDSELQYIEYLTDTNDNSHRVTITHIQQWNIASLLQK